MIIRRTNVQKNFLERCCTKMDKKKYQQYIDEKKDLICGVSDQIWEYAELSLQEFRSCELYVKTLKEEGFQVECPVAGIETAFAASYGSGSPVIGILGEYDALSGLSQKAGETVRNEEHPGGNGHGCGHNMLGAGAMAAAMGIKQYLSEKPAGSGTVIFFGCPGEEGGAAKAFMARDGIWKKLDCALTWHPDDCNQVSSGTCNSCIQTEYAFQGIASHAAGNPEQGRSALDAVEVMNIGVQFLREHMPDEARIHYAITDGGGISPNVVQPHAQVLYMVRSVLVKDALALQKRVDDIAEGAALITGTKMKKKFIDGCSNTVPNQTLESLLYKNFQEAGIPSYTPEEEAYAKELTESYEVKSDRLPGSAWEESKEIKAFVEEATENGTKPLNDFLIPYLYSEKKSPGSTDVGDVSWLCPTAQINTVCFAAGSPGHSWQNVSCGHTSIGHKGLLCAGKVLCGAAIDLYEDPALLEEAKAEFAEKTKIGFYSPVPEDAVPVISGEKIEF